MFLLVLYTYWNYLLVCLKVKCGYLYEHDSARMGCHWCAEKNANALFPEMIWVMSSFINTGFVVVAVYIKHDLVLPIPPKGQKDHTTYCIVASWQHGWCVLWTFGCHLSVGLTISFLIWNWLMPVIKWRIGWRCDRCPWCSSRDSLSKCSSMHYITPLSHRSLRGMLFTPSPCRCFNSKVKRVWTCTDKIAL